MDYEEKEEIEERVVTTAFCLFLFFIGFALGTMVVMTIKFLEYIF